MWREIFSCDYKAKEFISRRQRAFFSQFAKIAKRAIKIEAIVNLVVQEIFKKSSRKTKILM